MARKGRDEQREPLPAEGGKSHDEEELVTADRPAVGLRRISGRVAVQGVHDRASDQSRGPDHGSRPNQEATHHTRHAEAQGLGGQGEEDLEAPAPGLAVEDLLGHQGCRKRSWWRRQQPSSW